jgi:LmbE family N-acetylglucosaminyl deacetylase
MTAKKVSRCIIINLILFILSKSLEPPPVHDRPSISQHFPPLVVEQLSQLNNENWFENPSNNTAVKLWKNALISCPYCKLPQVNGGSNNYETLREIRDLPDRIFLWNELIPAAIERSAATHHDHTGSVDLNILSIGGTWFTIEEEIKILFHSNINKNHTNIKYMTIDTNPTVNHMFTNLCIQNALELPRTCYGINRNYFDIVIINGVVGWGINNFEKAQQMMQKISESAKPDAIVIVGRNIPRLCCSLNIYEKSSLSPLSLNSRLPWRKSFWQEERFGGGHVFDVMANIGGKELQSSLEELRVSFYTTIDEQDLYNVIDIPLGNNDIQQTLTNAAAKYCTYHKIVSQKQFCESSIHHVLSSHVDMHTHLVKDRNHCNKTSILFVAHPDDEALFAAEELTTESSCWIVVCATNKNNPLRYTEFLASMNKLGVAAAIIWDYDDCMSCVPLRRKNLPWSEFKDRVRFVLGLRNDWSKVVTHGFAGDYGHPQHKAVHNIIVEVSKELNLLDKVWCIHPIRWHENWLGETAGGKSYAQLERKNTLEEAYKSQQNVWKWLVNLETKFVPYLKHMSNISALSNGCPHSTIERGKSVAAFFRWFCLSWLRNAK